MEARVTLVDSIRGFALFGVVVSNVAVVWGSGAGSASGSSLDTKVGYLVAYLITGKFLALFALLFGASYGLYVRRAGASGVSSLPRHFRRMGILFLIGVLNRVLFGADILMEYAVLGVMLVLFRQSSDRTLAAAAIIALAIPELWHAFAGWTGYKPPPWRVDRAERLRLATDGPWLDLVRLRVERLPVWWNQFLGAGSYLSLLLAGFWAARRGLFDRPQDHRTAWRLLWWGGLAVTVLGYTLQEALRPGMVTGVPWQGIAFGLVWSTTTYVQGIAYGAGLVLLWMRGGRSRSLLTGLAPTGRMALTNYVAASAIGTIVAATTHTYGTIGVAAASAAGAVLWLIEIGWSRWWLVRYRQGPLEWIWRTASHRRAAALGAT